MVPRGEASLPIDAHHPGRHQVGSARRQGHHREAEGQETRAHHVHTGRLRFAFFSCICGHPIDVTLSVFGKFFKRS